ncbi:PIN domain-containing protein [Cokeromyces recurvatus]|uniref:PIN domain-containing protein n=1 Tax=Cokeromyces recurvatus TaxID=90255 RepID=UPI00221E679D|nr:PIN domain-containing protein [Cokeromyces recurvatus]KAI7897812.1 PIN domain-containing protein [Cokeromyces recurvatus]
MNNEHTEFMDIDGPEFIYDVNKEIKNMRERVHDSFHNVDIFNSKETTKQEIELDCYAEIAVLDTNFLISKLGYLDAVLDLANKHPYSLLVILPWIVIKELDGLKNGRKDVALSSRNAMRFIELRLRDKQISLKGQKKNEILDTTLLKNSRAKGDDLILDCCMYFQRLTQDKARMFPGNGSCRITLLSNDRNLCIKAMVHDVNTISADSTLEMEDLLNRIVLKKSLNTTSSNSLQQNEDHVMQKLLNFVLYIYISSKPLLS